MESPVIVLFGGPSDERKVSVATTQHVLSVLAEAQAWFVSPDLRVFRPSRSEVLAHEQPFVREFAPQGVSADARLEVALPEAPADAIFFLGMHGSFGEDGTVQRLLQEGKLAFTGSDAESSAAAFDKTAAKRFVAAAGVRVADANLLPVGDRAACYETLVRMLQWHGRVVAKPIAGGSSVGLHHVGNREDADRAAAAIAAQGQEYLCEAFIAGTELTVGVVDGPKGRRALPVSEVRVESGRAFDYEGKYLGKGTIEVTPAEVPADVARAAQQMALTAHKALGCFGYSRTDVIVGEKGPVFLETNTLPGLTRQSFIPQQLAAEGTSMRDFLAGQLELAKKRQASP